MGPVGDLFVCVDVLVDAALRAGIVPIPARRPFAPTPRCSRSPWSAPCWGVPVNGAFSPRCAATGPTISRTCRPSASSPAGSAGCGEPSRTGGSTWCGTFPRMPGRRGTPRPGRSSIPGECGDRMAGTGRATGTPALSGMRPPARCSTASAWRGGRTGDGAWSEPEASSRRRSTSARGPRPCGRALDPRACSAIEASPVGPGPPRKPKGRVSSCPRAERRRLPAASRRPAQSPRDDHWRAHRTAGTGPTRCQDLRGPADPHRRDDPGPDASAPWSDLSQ